MFPENQQLEKVKTDSLSKATREAIFEKFTFKNLNKDASALLILKEIYNTYFSMCIISSKRDQKANKTKYEIEDTFREWEKFAAKNLRLYPNEVGNEETWESSRKREREDESQCLEPHFKKQRQAKCRIKGPNENTAK